MALDRLPAELDADDARLSTRFAIDESLLGSVAVGTVGMNERAGSDVTERETIRPDERAGTWSEHAFTELRHDILSGRLQPGSKLRIEQLRVQYGVGSTPLREALSRLSSEGLVQIEQLKGFRVAAVTLAELEELCDLRVLIESDAMRRAVKFGDDAWEGGIVAAFYQLDRLEQRLKRGEMPDADDWEERNREFHEALVAGANSKWLLRLRRQLFDHFERYRRFARLKLSDAPARDLSHEHRAMMEAALARRGDDLAAMMSEHILANVPLLRDGFAAEKLPGIVRSTAGVARGAMTSRST